MAHHFAAVRQAHRVPTNCETATKNRPFFSLPVFVRMTDNRVALDITHTVTHTLHISMSPSGQTEPAVKFRRKYSCVY